MVFLC
jgi:hypothetical protein